MASGPGRDLKSAREAFAKDSKGASIAAHTMKIESGHCADAVDPRFVLRNRAIQAAELALIIAGVLTQILPTTAVANDDLGRLHACIILSIGAAMAALSLTRRRQEVALYNQERNREKWELSNYPKGEIDEMKELYEGKGVSTADAKLVIETMAKYEEFFVDVMMAEELCMMRPVETSVIVPYLSFAATGTLPVILPLKLHSFFGWTHATALHSATGLLVVLYLALSCGKARHRFQSTRMPLFAFEALVVIGFAIAGSRLASTLV